MNETTGELVRGRCRATNLCRYCQTLYVVETVEMLTLDAAEYAPTLWLVLTAREHLTRARCRDELHHLRRVLRRRWASIEWFVQVEFQRRGALHLNLLVKGVPIGELDELRAAVVGEWCARVDAEPVGQWGGAIEDGVGVVRYLAKMLAHGLKAEQRPPIGWRGHRTSQTRGYLVRPASVMREEARRALKLKRLIYRLGDCTLAELELAFLELQTWRLRGSLPADREHLLRESARAPFPQLVARVRAQPSRVHLTRDPARPPGAPRGRDSAPRPPKASGQLSGPSAGGPGGVPPGGAEVTVRRR